MKEETLTAIPPEEQAYEWARREMEKFFPKPDRFHILDLDKRVERPRVHESLFRKGPEDPVILRVYWADTDSVKYSIVVNFDELYSEHRELVERLLKKGQDAFDDVVKREPWYINELFYGKGSEYLS